MLRVILISLIVWTSLFGNTYAAELWSYEIQSGPNATHSSIKSAKTKISFDQHWLVSEFSWVPYPEQMEKLTQIKGFQKHTALFLERVVPSLKDNYLKLAQHWINKEIEGEFKFVNSLVTEDEAQALKPACSLGVPITFYTTQLPTPYEAKNLLTLKQCVRVYFSIGRYFRFDDLESIKALKNLSISLQNNYFPAYIHMDNLNLIQNPVTLAVNETLPSEFQVNYLNGIDRLEKLNLSIDLYPSDDQYTLLKKISVPLTLQWNFGQPRTTDLDYWKKLNLKQVVLSYPALQQSPVLEKIVRELKTLHSNIIFKLQE